MTISKNLPDWIRKEVVGFAGGTYADIEEAKADITEEGIFEIESVSDMGDLSYTIFAVADGYNYEIEFSVSTIAVGYDDLMIHSVR